MLRSGKTASGIAAALPVHSYTPSSFPHNFYLLFCSLFPLTLLLLQAPLQLPRCQPLFEAALAEAETGPSVTVAVKFRTTNSNQSEVDWGLG